MRPRIAIIFATILVAIVAMVSLGYFGFEPISFEETFRPCLDARKLDSLKNISIEETLRSLGSWLKDVWSMHTDILSCALPSVFESAETESFPPHAKYSISFPLPEKIIHEVFRANTVTPNASTISIEDSLLSKWMSSSSKLEVTPTFGCNTLVLIFVFGFALYYKRAIANHADQLLVLSDSLLQVQKDLFDLRGKVDTALLKAQNARHFNVIPNGSLSLNNTTLETEMKLSEDDAQNRLSAALPSSPTSNSPPLSTQAEELLLDLPDVPFATLKSEFPNVGSDRKRMPVIPVAVMDTHFLVLIAPSGWGPAQEGYVSVFVGADRKRLPPTWTSMRFSAVLRLRVEGQVVGEAEFLDSVVTPCQPFRNKMQWVAHALIPDAAVVQVTLTVLPPVVLLSD